MSLGASLRLQQEVADTYRHALIGGYFYLAGWLVVAIYGQTFKHSPIISWSLTLVFLGLAIARRLHKRPLENVDATVFNQWLKWHWSIVLSTTALFGLVFVWTLIDERLAAGHTAVLLSTMGLSVAVAHAFSMRLNFAMLCVLVMYLPGLVTLWLTPKDPASAWVMTIYLLYVVATLWRSHHEYQHRLDIDQQLRDQSDLFEKQGRVDALTELADRRFFTETLMQMSQNAKAGNSDLVLMVLDLDHFKSINDQYGHAVGDSCLAIFASRLKIKFDGGGGHAARLGGEEFGVLLQGLTLDIAMQQAENFREMCVSEPIRVGDIIMPMTVSIGVAKFDPDAHSDGDGLYRAADSAVYRAKNAGRNHVCSYQLAVV